MEGFKTKKQSEFIKYSNSNVKGCYLYVSRDSEMLSIDGYWLGMKAAIDIDQILPIIPYCGFIFTDLVNEYTVFCTNSKAIAHNYKILKVLEVAHFSDYTFKYLVNDNNKPTLIGSDYINLSTREPSDKIKGLITDGGLMERREEISNEQNLKYLSEVFGDANSFISTNECIFKADDHNNEDLVEKFFMQLYVNSHNILGLEQLPEMFKEYELTFDTVQEAVEVEAEVEETAEPIVGETTASLIEESHTEEPVIEEPIAEEPQIIEEAPAVVEDTVEENSTVESVDEKEAVEYTESSTIESTEETNEETVEQIDENTDETKEVVSEESTVKDYVSDIGGPELIIDNINNYVEPEPEVTEEVVEEVQQESESQIVQEVVEEVQQEDLAEPEKLEEDNKAETVETQSDEYERPRRQREDYSDNPIFKEMDEMEPIKRLHSLYRIIAPQNYVQ